MAEVNGIKVPFIPIAKETIYSGRNVPRGIQNFEDIFRKELDNVKFSSHAIKRLENRNINLTADELDKIQSAVEKAELKGSLDSLVIMNDKAFIVNIPNRTVVTAMQLGIDNDNIFTNIDSVVLT